MNQPTSIAGLASLLAGSELGKRSMMLEGTERMSDEELQLNGAFDGRLFTLGWYSGGVKRGGTFEIGVEQVSTKLNDL